MSIRSHRGQRKLLAILSGAVITTLISASAAQAAVPGSWVTEQVNFILSKQRPSGAIVGANSLIMPYFANVAAIGLIQANTTSSRAGALSWMQWYLAHRNPAATNVPTNSVFDYIYNAGTGSETPTGDFDSVDSYASTTLNLAYAAYTSGSPALASYVSSHILDYEGIANLLTYSAPIGVRAKAGVNKGLTIAKPAYPVAYTMDNSEVYSGLVDFASLETVLGRTSQASYYSDWAASTKSNFLSKLWNASNNNWNSAVGEVADTTLFYAGGTAQLWPVLYGVLPPTDPKAIAGWNQFETMVPNWYVSVPDNYAWTSVARAAQIMGETANATTDLNNIHARFAPTFAYPTSCGVSPCGEWYDNEAGWFIIAGLR